MANVFYDLTNPQKSILLTEQYYKDTNINNICGTAIVNEKINFNLLEKAINKVIEENDSFRIAIIKKDSKTLQYVKPYQFVSIELVDLTTKNDVANLENSTLRNIFNLEEKLFEFKMFRFPEGNGGFMLNIHHIISDGWTLGLTCRKIMLAYSILNNEIPEEDISSSYIDYIQSEKEYFNSQKFINDKNYWNEIFTTIPPTVTIPGSLNNENNFSSKANRKEFILPKDLVDKIKEYCKENKITIFNFFMAILAIYIYKINSVDDFVIGTPILNRTNFKEKNTNGMFVNISPFRININSNNDFIEFVNKIAHDSRDMLKHQKYSYNNILEDVRKIEPSTPVLYNIILSYQVTKANNVSNYNYETRWAFNGNCSEDIEIQLYDLDDTGELTISFDYKLQKYAETDIENIEKRILFISEQILNNDKKIKDIKIATPSEENLILNQFNNTKLEYNENTSIIEIFEKRVLESSNLPALTFHNETLTFKELNEKANSLAFEIKQKTNFKNPIIPIISYRSLEVIIGILAILKAGGAYLPIDPDYPKERIDYILKTTNPDIILTQKGLANKIDLKNTIYIDLKDNQIYSKNTNNFKHDISLQDLSYLIFTSGSTGLPKGVKLTHKNYLNFYNAMINEAEYLKNGTNYSMISITTISFDIFGFETITSLLSGVHVFMTDNFEQKDTASIAKIVKQNNISTIQTTPSVMKFHIENLKDSSDFSNLKYFILAGEQLPKELVQKIKKIAPNATIYNGYGPSETTIFSTFTDVTNAKEISIGKGIGNTQIYILNKDLNLLPPNNIGEIYIAGNGVGNGYLNRDDLTKKAFLQNPFGDGIIYKTGDIGVFNNLGELYCKGRSDNQIKLHGLRIELEEIEFKINTYKKDISINSVVVLRKINNRDCLHAFLTTSSPINLEELKKYLMNNLPNYMVPSSYSVLDEFPRTPNGKIDKKALPQKIEIANIINSPTTNTQITLCNILGELLKIKIKNINENIFNLGVDSLIAIQFITEIKNHFNKNINIKDIFENNTIYNLAVFLENTNTENLKLIKPCPIQKYYNISAEQNGIFYMANMSKKPVYNLTGGIEFFEEIDVKKIEKCFNKLVKRHEVFRTQFKFENGQVVQEILDNVNIKLEILDAKGKSKTKILDDFNIIFDLSVAPLLKVGIAKLENNHYLLIVCTHHIIVDGTSFQILINDFCKLYNNEKLSELKLTYKDYAYFEKENLENNILNESKKYWTDKFNKELPTLNLPTTYTRPSVFTYTGFKLTKTISKNLTEHILEFCNKNEITPFMFMISAYYIILHKYSDSNDILIGSPVANREHNDISNIIGMFVNTLVLEAEINDELTFNDFCSYIKDVSLDAFKHQDYPFNELVKTLNIKRDLSRNLMFDVLFTYQNIKNSNFSTIQNSEFILPTHTTSKFDLSLEVIPNENNMTLNFEYCTDLFSKEFINDFAKHYIEIIKNVIKKPETKIKDINMLDEKEFDNLVYEFNKTTLDYPKTITVSKLFENQVKEKPTKTAVIFENNKLTYEELNKKANNLAYYLQTKGIKEGKILGILINRSLEVLVCQLAILKLGCTYVPIDPTYPEQRVKYILDNSKMNIVLTEPQVKEKFNIDCQMINCKLDNKKIYNNEHNENPNIKFKASNLAYIIYTSGSTGNPKGVMITNQNVVNFIYAINDRLKLDPNLTFVSLTTICFDIFVLESLYPICSGMTTVIANNEEQTIPQKLNALCKSNNIKILQTTPSKLMLLLSDDNSNEYIKNLNYILVGGEAVPSNLIKKLKTLTNAKIFNMYGPTETTVWSTIQDLTVSQNITIGTPIANTYTYILNNNHSILPVGIPGNLFIGGDGVGNGYLNRDDLTNEHFIENPFIPNTKIYDTGDIAKLLPNGEISYIGRSDFQVKVHGLRIELGEIEKQISSFEDISNSAVTVKKDGAERDILCAYFVANKAIDFNKLKEFLRKNLPEYMIPVYFKQMNDFKYTPNGKIDRKSLPSPEFIRNSKDIVVPETPTEKLVTKIVENILTVHPISITDNLFNIGADSLTALRLQIELLNENINIPYADIFKYNTIKDLSLRIDSNIKTEVTLQSNSYDYAEIDNLISKNNIKALDNIKFTPIQNVILTGSTGFLGAHILSELIDNHDIKIFCLIRKNANKATISERLKEILNFYFGNKYDKEFGNRIIPIEADICDEDLKLSKSNYNLLKNNANIIINSAANVKHYGYYSDFEKVNVTGVKNLIKFALDTNKKFIQISTTSVSGNTLVGEKTKLNTFNHDINYNEQKFFTGQSLENVYTYSKFEAEKAVFENIIKNNLDGLVLRVGYITPRYADGVFQINKLENALYNRIQTFIKLGNVPESLKKFPVEFTPVDCLAKAIINSIEFYNNSINVLHLYNPNHIIIKDLVNAISGNASIIPDESFRNLIKEILKNPNKRNILSSIVNDMDSKFNLIYSSDIKLNNDFSVKFLEKTGFNWPIIDEKYIKLMLYLFEL